MTVETDLDLVTEHESAISVEADFSAAKVMPELKRAAKARSDRMNSRSQQCR